MIYTMAYTVCRKTLPTHNKGIQVQYPDTFERKSMKTSEVAQGIKKNLLFSNKSFNLHFERV